MQTAEVSTIKKRKKRSSFFLIMGIVGLLAIHIGFAKTYLMPVAQGNFKAPLVVYIHGALAFSWILLFFVQTVLIRVNNFRLHRTLGFSSFIIALGTAITTVLVGRYAVEKELANGLGETAISTIFGTITSAILFLSLVIAGYVKRKRPQVHKRLMLLATIVLLWPAWFRFRHYFPPMERPDIWFGLVLADSLIIISWIWDRIANGRVHPTLLYVGLFIIAEQTFEVFMFDSGWWRISSNWIYNLIS
jgi:hypothetical protein